MGLSIQKQLVRAVAPKMAQKPAARASVAAAQATAAAARVEASTFRQAVSRIEKRIAAEKMLQVPGNKAKLHLQPHYESLFKAHTDKAKGTVVMFHGFTAGPWQYKDLADRLYKEGYHVYAPRLPGHGLMRPNGKTTSAQVINATQRHQYERYIDRVFKEASDLGAPVYAVGLSGGGNVALRMAEKHGVKGTVAIAPFLGPNKPYQYGSEFLYSLDKATFGGLGWVLDRIPKGKSPVASANNLMPHTPVTFGQALANRSVGHNVKKIDTPVQFITTAGDFLSGTDTVGALFSRSGGAAKHGWFHFAAEEKVPHAMVSRMQNKAPGAVDRMEQVILDFIEQGKSASRLPR